MMCAFSERRLLLFCTPAKMNRILIYEEDFCDDPPPSLVTSVQNHHKCCRPWNLLQLEHRDMRVSVATNYYS